MSNSANGNTTNLGSSGTRLTQMDYSNYSERLASREVARSNLKFQMGRDAKLKKYYSLVYNTVSSWSKGDKLRIISEHGDVTGVNENTKNEQLNAIVTELLIVTMNEGHLQAMVRSVATDEQELYGKTQAIQKNRRKQVSHFNAGSFSEFAKTQLNVKDPKTLIKHRHRLDRTFQVPFRNIIRRYRMLQRELDLILRGYDKIRLAEAASSLGIDFSNGASIANVRRGIINVCILYVDMIAGHSKRMNFSAATPTGYTTIEDLLSYTSFGWVVGRDALTDEEIQAKRKVAREARARQQARLHMFNDRARTRSKEFQEVAGTSGGRRASRRNIRNNDTGVLRNATNDQILELASSYGIDVTRRSNIETIKMEIYQALAAQNRRNRTIKNNANRHQFNIEATSASSASSALRGSIENILNPKIASDIQTSYTGFPIVSFNGKGILTTKNITSAIPVWIVGQGWAGKNIGPNGPTPAAAASAISGNGQTAIKSQLLKTELAEDVESDFSKLDQRDRDRYNWYLQNPPLRNPANANTPTESILEIIEEFQVNGRQGAITTRLRNTVVKLFHAAEEDEIKNNGNYDAELRSQLNFTVAYIEAVRNGRRKLANYITITYGIKFPNKLIFSANRRNGRRMGIGAAIAGAGIFSAAIIGGAIAAGPVGMIVAGAAGILGGAIAAGIRQGIQSRRIHNATSVADLPDADQQFYRQGMDLDYSALYNIVCNKYRKNGGFISEFFMKNNTVLRSIMGVANVTGNGNTEFNNVKKEMLLYIISLRNNNRPLVILLENRYNRALAGQNIILPSNGDKYSEETTTNFNLRKDFNNRSGDQTRRSAIASFFGRHLSIFKAGATTLGDLFSFGAASRNKKNGNVLSGETPAEEGLNEDTGIASGPIIPKIVLQDGTEAVRVFVVNNGISGGSTPGIQQNISRITRTNLWKKPVSNMTRDTSLSLGPGAGRRTKYSSAGSIFEGLDDHNPFVADLGNIRQTFQTEASSDGGESGKAIRVFDVGNIMNQKLQDAKGKGKGSQLSGDSQTLGIRSVIKTPAAPVFLTNSSIEVNSDATAWLSSNLPTLFMGLQMGGTAFNAASASSAPLMIAGGVSAGLGTALAGMGVKLATGGEGKANTAASRGTTHFISGDSLSRKPNPEQVSIDWSKKSFSVNPIPAFAKGGGEDSSGTIKRMTSSERNEPMSVGISSNLVSFNRKLTDVVDDGSGKAIKVYAVNYGITDKVDVNGTSVSLMELLSAINTQVAGLIQTSAANVTATTSAAKITAAAISSLKSSNSSSSNPFTSGSFPSELDGILSGQ